MKDLGAHGLDEEDFSVVDLLVELGLDAKQARVLRLIHRAGEARSSDFQTACRLRQPEVSMALKALRNQGWLDAEARKGPGKGRPVHYYRLKVPFADVVDGLEASRREALKAELEKIGRLRRLVTKAPGREGSAGEPEAVRVHAREPEVSVPVSTREEGRVLEVSAAAPRPGSALRL